jgi:hypothetical protein
MSDMPSYDRNKAAIKQRETPLNKDGGKGQVPCSPNQSSALKRRPMGHIDPGIGQKS